MYVDPACGGTSRGNIWPGSLDAKATIPGPPWALYSVMKIELPPTARLKTPPSPPPPPNCVDVFMTMLDVIQDSSPDSANSASPGSSVISRTGMTVPMIFSCICSLLLADPVGGGTSLDPDGPGLSPLVVLTPVGIIPIGDKN